MKNMVCKVLKAIIVSLALMTFICGCDKPFKLSYPLAVTQRNITLNKDGGSTHVLVYSTEKWSAGFVSPVSWASLNKTVGYGNSDFVFDYSPNYGVARKVQIALVTDVKCDTINMVQKGSITEVSFVPEYKNIMLVRQAATARISVFSNVRYGLEVMNSTVQYEDEYAEPWIDDIRVSADSLYFNVKENPDGLSRKAWVTLTLPDVTGATTNLVTCRLTVTQTKDDPALSLQKSSVSLDAKSQHVTVLTDRNNIWAYGSSVKLDVKSDAKDGDWLNNVRFTQDGLLFDVKENKGGQSRAATVSLSFETSDGCRVSADCAVNQSNAL